MIPCLALQFRTRRKVGDVIREYAEDDVTFEALRATVEEYGGDEEGIKEVIASVEEKGNVAPGLWDAIATLMAGKNTGSLGWCNSRRSRVHY